MQNELFSELLATLIDERKAMSTIWFSSDKHSAPLCSYQVDFPRLEFVLSGTYNNEIDSSEIGTMDVELHVGDALYIPPNSWNKPSWETDCSILSLLFGRRQLGFSLVSKRADDIQFYDVQKYSVPTRSGHALDGILAALNSLAIEPYKHPMSQHLMLALLTYSQSMVLSANKIKQKDTQYQGICIYINENFHHPLTRDSIAKRFNLSANHLSRLFRQHGHLGLSDYITWVRLERAKFLLKKYHFRLNEIAVRCGFNDVNYFCRVFKKQTGKTPTQYRNEN